MPADAPLLTPAEFASLAARMARLTAHTRAVARAVLVEGLRPVDAARRFGISRQRVHAIVQRTRAAAEGLPTDWRRVEVWLPPQLAREVEAMAAAARGARDAPSRPGFTDGRSRPATPKQRR